MRTVEPDLIFHLASHVAGSRSLELVMPTFSGNLVTTVNLLAAATEIGCRRIVLTGSLEEPSPEADWLVPSSPYAAAKYAASTYARMFHNLYQTPVVILRLFMVYGPAQQDLKKLIPYVILSLLEGRAPQMSSGVRKVDWVYVDDVVNAYLAAATANAAEGHTFDIGSGTLIRVRDVVERLAEAVNPKVMPLFGAIPDRLYEQERVADVGRASAVLGWQPTTNLDEGLGR